MKTRTKEVVRPVDPKRERQAEQWTEQMGMAAALAHNLNQPLAVRQAALSLMREMAKGIVYV